MSSARVTAVQFGSGLDPADNRARIEALLEETVQPGSSDLVVLPEASSRDFGRPGSDLSDAAEALDGPFVAMLQRVAGRLGAVLVAGMFEHSPDPARPFNTLVVVSAEGPLATYRKIHLYDSFGYRESDVLAAGSIDPVRFTLGGLSWGLLTCYDLRFPELVRTSSLAGVDGLLVPSAWVAGPRKIGHWTTLLRARAIENVAYVVAAGQPEPRYTGHSTVIDPRGDVLAATDGAPDVTVTADVDPAVVAEARRENPSLDNRRL